MKKRIGVFAALLLLAVATVPADEGRKEIFAPVLLTGTNLSGNYFLSRDVTATVGVAIDVVGITGSESVEINLNGFSVSGVSGSPVIRVSNVRSFTLRNGSVIADMASGVKITGISAVEDQVVLEDLKLNGGDKAIELVDVNNFLIQRLLVVGASGSGIDISLSPSPTTTLSGRIVQNSIRNSDIGINIAAVNEAVEIRNNTILSNVMNSRGVKVVDSNALIVSENNIVVTAAGDSGAHGIGLTDAVACIVDRNTIQGGDNGISLENVFTCSITNNVAEGNNGHGLKLWGVAGGGSDFNKIGENSFSNNKFSGIRLQNDSDQNFIAANDTNNNLVFGIHFDSSTSDNRYGFNSAIGNTAGACMPTAGSACQFPPFYQDFCDEGTANLSFSANLVPGPC